MDRNLLTERLVAELGDELKAQALLERSEKVGKPFDRLFVSKINQPVKSAAEPTPHTTREAHLFGGAPFLFLPGAPVLGMKVKAELEPDRK